MDQSMHFGCLVLSATIVGDYGTNQRAVEIHLMRRFQSNQVIKDIPLRSLFRETFEPLLMKLLAKQSGTLKELFHELSIGVMLTYITSVVVHILVIV